MGFFSPRCPDGHGALLDGEWGGRLFCPHHGHGGNGRFFAPSELEDTMGLRAAGPAPKPGKKDTGAKNTPLKTDDDLLPGESLGPVANADGSPTEITKKMLAGTGRDPVAFAAKATKTTPICLCGCGETTKGGRFRPGHDARYHAAQKRAAAEAQNA